MRCQVHDEPSRRSKSAETELISTANASLKTQAKQQPAKASDDSQTTQNSLTTQQTKKQRQVDPGGTAASPKLTEKNAPIFNPQAKNSFSEVNKDRAASFKTLEVSNLQDKDSPGKVIEKTTPSSNALSIFNLRRRSSFTGEDKNKTPSAGALVPADLKTKSSAKQSALQTLEVVKLQQSGPVSSSGSRDLEVPPLVATYRRRSTSFEDDKSTPIKVLTVHRSTLILFFVKVQ